MKLAVMDGPMYAFSNGLVFVSRPTKVHVLLLEQVRMADDDVAPAALWMASTPHAEVLLAHSVQHDRYVHCCSLLLQPAVVFD